MKQILLLLLLPSIIIAQKNDTLHHYFDQNFAPTKMEKAVYFGISFKDADHWLLYAIYRDNSPALRAYYKDKNFKEKDGPFTMYFPGKQTAIACTYHNNRKSGLWRSWYENGQIKDSCLLADDQIVGEYRKWFANGQLNIVCNYIKSADIPVARALNISDIVNLDLKYGFFQSWYENGHKESEGVFRNNQMDSVWHFYFENGQHSTVERYSNGKLASLQCFDSTGNEAGEFCSVSKPATVKGVGDYHEHIRENLLWPAEALKKKIEGTVTVALTVSKEGELTLLEIKSDESILKNAVEKVFSNFKEWYPAVSHNRPVEWHDEFEVPFYQSE